MNRYTLAADGHRWWWRPALAGTVATAALTTIVALPVAGQAMPEIDWTGTAPTRALTVLDAPGTSHPCFLYRARWNEALDGPRPVCTAEVRVVTDVPEPFADVIRPGLDT